MFLGRVDAIMVLPDPGAPTSNMSMLEDSAPCGDDGR